MEFNPFAFGAANYALGGPELFLYSFLKACYKHAGAVVQGTRDELLTAAFSHEENQYSREELEEGFDRILEGKKHGDKRCRPLILIDEEGKVVPTEAFGIMRS